jgi:O-acetyl-ADP-ribose deacetylase (regulator of RNase III)
MIQLTSGNILESHAEALVNTVNCVGVMGRGIALQFKRTFPSNYKVYKTACDQDEVKPGQMLIVETGSLMSPKYVINFPTKRHWKSNSLMEDIRSGLEALVLDIQRLEIKSIAVPPLGCGLGGLQWSRVLPLIEEAFATIPDVDIFIYEPKGAPSSETIARDKQAPNLTVGRAALIGLMDRYIAGLLDPFISLLEVHKLMYFLQECGQPLRLKYVKGHYGPYAENLRHVLGRIEGHFIKGYKDGGDEPFKALELVPGVVENARSLLEGDQTTKMRFDRVAELVDGFETSFGMELLSTVHWVATHEGASDLNSVVEKVYAWSERKRRFSAEQIGLAWNILLEQGWLRGSVVRKNPSGRMSRLE